VQIGWSFVSIALLVLFGCAEQPNARTGREARGNELSEKDIRRVVAGHMGSLRSCYQNEVKRNPTVAGTVTAKWEIQPAGHVTKVRLTDSTLHNEHVEGCIVREVLRWRFPSSASGTNAEWPLRFGVAVDLDDGSR
jgi:hypothetical protein